jgi:putative colanic acid biosynthesis acetyltransferase WcaF
MDMQCWIEAFLPLLNGRFATTLMENEMNKPMRRRQISRLSFFGRTTWQTVWLLLFRPSPVPFHAWRRLLLRIFGAKMGKETHVYPTTKIWAPWNLTMGDFSGLGPYVDCYSVDAIDVGPYAAVSQYSFLCTASHDYALEKMPLISAPIIIGQNAWVAADVFVGPGVSIGAGAVALARSTVLDDVLPWTVVGGSPAKFIKHRTIRMESEDKLIGKIHKSRSQ